MKNPGIEAKVAYSGATGAAVSLILGLAAAYHWFTPPPPYLTGLAVTVLAAAAGWLAPHTPRTAAQPVIRIGGDPSKQPAIIQFDGTVADADVENLKAALKGIGFGPAVTPPAAAPQPETTTGATT